MVRDDDGNDGAKFEDCGGAQMTCGELRGLPHETRLELTNAGKSAGVLFISWH